MFTVAHLIESFLADMKVQVRAGLYAATTLRWYRDQFTHLTGIKAVKAMPADALRLTHLTSLDLSNGFVRALKRLYRWGAAEDLLPKDPFAKLCVPPCGQRERTLTREELCRLYRAAYPAFRRLLYVQLNTLARPGEIRQLTWGQINWELRVIVLVDYKGKKRRREKVKARCIPLPKAVVRLLRNLYRKAKDKKATDRVFVAPRGRPWTANGVRCTMRRTRIAAGLDDGDEPVVCYHLRHTGATNAIRTEADLKQVAEVMGHARSTTTERYIHLNAGDVVDTIDRMLARRRQAVSPEPSVNRQK